MFAGASLFRNTDANTFTKTISLINLTSMQTASLLSTHEHAINYISEYVNRKGYKHISINYISGEIRVKRKYGLFQWDRFRIKVVPVERNISTMEITINPENKKTTKAELERERKLRNKLFFYF